MRFLGRPNARNSGASQTARRHLSGVAPATLLRSQDGRVGIWRPEWLVAQLKADPTFKSEAERVKAFRKARGGGRSTYFKFAKQLYQTVTAETTDS